MSGRGKNKKQSSLNNYRRQSMVVPDSDVVRDESEHSVDSRFSQTAIRNPLVSEAPAVLTQYSNVADNDDDQLNGLVTGFTNNDHDSESDSGAEEDKKVSDASIAKSLNTMLGQRRGYETVNSNKEECNAEFKPEGIVGAIIQPPSASTSSSSVDSPMHLGNESGGRTRRDSVSSAPILYRPVTFDTPSPSSSSHSAASSNVAKTDKSLEAFLNDLTFSTFKLKQLQLEAREGLISNPNVVEFARCLAEAVSKEANPEDHSVQRVLACLNGIEGNQVNTSTLAGIYAHELTIDGQKKTIASILHNIFALTFSQAAKKFLAAYPETDFRYFDRRWSLLQWMHNIGEFSKPADREAFMSYHAATAKVVLDKLPKYFARLTENLGDNDALGNKIPFSFGKAVKLGEENPYAATLIRLLLVAYIDQLSSEDFKAKDQKGEKNQKKKWLLNYDEARHGSIENLFEDKDVYMKALLKELSRNNPTEKDQGISAAINKLGDFIVDARSELIDEVVLRFGSCLERYLPDDAGVDFVSERTLELCDSADMAKLTTWLSSLEAWLSSSEKQKQPSSRNLLNKRLVDAVLNTNLKEGSEDRYERFVFPGLAAEDREPKYCYSEHRNQIMEGCSDRIKYYHTYFAFFDLLCRYFLSKFSCGFSGEFPSHLTKLCLIIDDANKDVVQQLQTEKMMLASWEYSNNSESYDSAYVNVEDLVADKPQNELNMLIDKSGQLSVALRDALEDPKFLPSVEESIQNNVRAQARELGQSLYGAFNPRSRKFRSEFDKKKNSERMEEKTEFAIKALFTPGHYHPPLEISNPDSAVETTSKLCKEIAEFYPTDDADDIRHGVWLKLAGTTDIDNFYTNADSLKKLCNYYSSNANANELIWAMQIAVFAFDNKNYEEHRLIFARLMLKIVAKMGSKIVENVASSSNESLDLISNFSNLEKNYLLKALTLLCEPSHLMSKEELALFPDLLKATETIGGDIEAFGERLYVKAEQQKVVVEVDTNANNEVVITHLLGLALRPQYSAAQATAIDLDFSQEVAAPKSLPAKNPERTVENITKEFHEILAGLVDGAFPEKHRTTNEPLSYRLTRSELRSMLWEQIKIAKNIDLFATGEITARAIHIAISAMHQEIQTATGIDFTPIKLQNDFSFFDQKNLNQAARAVFGHLRELDQEIQSQNASCSPAPADYVTAKDAAAKWLAGSPTQENIPDAVKSVVDTTALTAVGIKRLKEEYDEAGFRDHFAYRMHLIQKGKINECLQHVRAKRRFGVATASGELFAFIKELQPDAALSLLGFKQVEIISGSKSLPEKSFHKLYISYGESTVTLRWNTKTESKSVKIDSLSECPEIIKNLYDNPTKELSPKDIRSVINAAVTELGCYHADTENEVTSKKYEEYKNSFLWTVVETFSANVKVLDHLQENYKILPDLISLGFRRFVAMQETEKETRGPKLLKTLMILTEALFKNRLAKDFRNKHRSGSPETARTEILINELLEEMRASIDNTDYQKIDLVAQSLFYRVYTLAQAASYVLVRNIEDHRFDPTNSPLPDVDLKENEKNAAESARELIKLIHIEAVENETLYEKFVRPTLNLSKQDDSPLEKLTRHEPHPASQINAAANRAFSEAINPVETAEKIKAMPRYGARAYGYDKDTRKENLGLYDARLVFKLEAMSAFELVRRMSSSKNTGLKDEKLPKLTGFKEQTITELEQQHYIIRAAKSWHAPETYETGSPHRSHHIAAVIHVADCVGKKPEAMLSDIQNKAFDSFNRMFHVHEVDKKAERAKHLGEYGLDQPINMLLREEVEEAIRTAPAIRSAYIEHTLKDPLKSMEHADFILSLFQENHPGNDQEKRKSHLSAVFHHFYADIHSCKQREVTATNAINRFDSLLKKVKDYGLYVDYFAFLLENKGPPQVIASSASESTAFLIEHNEKLFEFLRVNCHANEIADTNKSNMVIYLLNTATHIQSKIKLRSKDSDSAKRRLITLNTKKCREIFHPNNLPAEVSHALSAFNEALNDKQDMYISVVSGPGMYALAPAHVAQVNPLLSSVS